MILKKLFTILTVFYSSLLAAQNMTTHFINDAAYRDQVEKDFQKQKKLTSGRTSQLYNVFDEKLSLAESEALKFLFAYMPISDLADYDGKFFLGQARMSLLARETFSWGKTIPEDIFRHFVLPYRINNENLDTARKVFFYELKDRIKNLSMHDAALEVNHWCHEKVTYRPTDSRTSAPLSTVCTAFGRCGEESTFAVTAFRAVGIPARQVYTPRWAHCDDNHAWVEVWIDGQWHFLGACEPEPDLDMAWFAGPALRAMMCNTTVFGHYISADEPLKSTDNYTQINLISNYAPTKKLFVKTVGDDLKPLENATVEFQLYNYAEFYPLARKNTDKSGTTFLTTGLGDLLIWAYSGDKFGFAKVTVEKTDTAVILVNQKPPQDSALDLTMIPPVQRQPKTADEKGKKENEKRLQNEDKIRSTYEGTFIDSVTSCLLAKQYTLNTDSVWSYLKQSRGNWKEISSFIKSAAPVNKVCMYQILDHISQKDLRDTPAEILLEHLQNSDVTFVKTSETPLDYFYNYVLNPRIAGEILSEYKGYFQQQFDKTAINNFRKDPSLLIKFVSDNITVSPLANYSRNPLTPKGTHQLKIADETSRDIYFVALCRSFGIPAQVNPATKLPEYVFNNQWNQVHFDKIDIDNTPKAELTLIIDTATVDFKPGYYTHFTIERFDEGFYRSLDYEESSVFNTYPATVTLDSGNYLIVTGLRSNDGSVSVHMQFFTLNPREQKTITLQFLQTEEMPKILGNLSLNSTFENLTGKKSEKLENFANQKGIILGWLDPDREPTKHTLSDFIQLKDAFEKWNGGIVFLLPEEKSSMNFGAQSFPELPEQSAYGIDKNKLLSIAEKNLNYSFGNNFPVFLVIDKTGNIFDFSSGYKIGRGEQIVKMLKYLH